MKQVGMYHKLKRTKCAFCGKVKQCVNLEWDEPGNREWTCLKDIPNETYETYFSDYVNQKGQWVL